MAAENLTITGNLMQDALEAINTRLVSLLSEDKQKELEVLLDTEPKEEQLTGFLKKCPNGCC